MPKGYFMHKHNIPENSVLLHARNRGVIEIGPKIRFCAKKFKCLFKWENLDSIAEKIIAAGIEEVEIRTILTCKTKNGVCTKCYGRNLATGNLVEVGEVLHVENANYIARINYVDAPSFSSLTADNIKNAFENITEYKVENIVSKTYSGVSCFEGNITYTNNAKTALLLCNREEGYWSIEVGTRGFSAFPTSDVNNSVVKIIAEAKKVTVEDSPLKVGKVQVEVPTESPTETENQ